MAPLTLCQPRKVKPAVYQLAAIDPPSRITGWGWAELAEVAEMVGCTPRDLLSKHWEFKDPESSQDPVRRSKESLHLLVELQVDPLMVQHIEIDLWPPSVRDLSCRLHSLSHGGKWVVRQVPFLDYLSTRRVFVPTGWALAVIKKVAEGEAGQLRHDPIA